MALVYISICIYIYIYICTYTCIHTYIYTYTCTSTYIHIGHVYTSKIMHASVCERFVCICMCICIYKLTHAYTYTLQPYAREYNNVILRIWEMLRLRPLCSFHESLDGCRSAALTNIGLVVGFASRVQVGARIQSLQKCLTRAIHHLKD